MKRAIATILLTVGFLIILGTAGTSDTSYMPFSQILIQCAVGIGMMCGGFIVKEVM